MTEYLLSYGVVGIQRLLLDNRWQPAIRGVSQAVANFDEATERLAEVRFARGGQGLAVTSDLNETVKRIAASANKHIPFGTVAHAAVPRAGNVSEQALLQRLRRTAEMNKDSAPAPTTPLPKLASNKLCPNCRRRDPVEKVEFDDEIMVCETCRRLVGLGRDRLGRWKEQRELGKLSDENRLAMIIADGNGIGEVLDRAGTSMKSLVECSQWLTDCFAKAGNAAAEAGGGDERVLTSISGGDDIHVFLDPRGVLPFVETFVQEVNHRAREPIGFSFGVVVAGDHYPARRLAEYGHSLVDRAKALCRRDKVRSAVGLAFLTVGDEGERSASWGDIFAVDSEHEHTWDRAVRSARALRRVHGAQRSLVLGARRAESDVEVVDNLFRYHVARHPQWREYLGALGRDWRNAEDVTADAVTPTLHDMARFLLPKSEATT